MKLFLLRRLFYNSEHKSSLTLKWFHQLKRQIIFKNSRYPNSELTKNSLMQPNEIWKSLNSLGLSSKNKSGSKICLNHYGKLNYEPTSINANVFKRFFSNLADDLLQKLPNPKHKYYIDSIHSYKSRIEKEFLFIHSCERGNNLKIVRRLKSTQGCWQLIY